MAALAIGGNQEETPAITAARNPGTEVISGGSLSVPDPVAGFTASGGAKPAVGEGYGSGSGGLEVSLEGLALQWSVVAVPEGGVVTGKVVEAGFMPAREDVALRWNYLAFSGGFCDEGVLVMEGAIDPGGQAGKVQYFRLVGRLLSSCGGDPSLIVKLLRRKELGKEKREGSVVASGRDEEVAGSRKKKRAAVDAVDEDSFSAGVRDHFPDPIME